MFLQWLLGVGRRQVEWHATNENFSDKRGRRSRVPQMVVSNDGRKYQDVGFGDVYGGSFQSG